MALLINQNLTANGSTALATLVNPNNGANIYQVICASGDFGGGTLTVEISNDGGATFFDATDSAGSVTLLADGCAATFILGGENLIKVQATLAGATDPDLNITITDAR